MKKQKTKVKSKVDQFQQLMIDAAELANSMNVVELGYAMHMLAYSSRSLNEGLIYRNAEYIKELCAKVPGGSILPQDDACRVQVCTLVSAKCSALQPAFKEVCAKLEEHFSEEKIGEIIALVNQANDQTVPKVKRA